MLGQMDVGGAGSYFNCIWMLSFGIGQSTGLVELGEMLWCYVIM
jgi:hypothetical protein